MCSGNEFVFCDPVHKLNLLYVQSIKNNEGDYQALGQCQYIGTSTTLTPNQIKWCSTDL